MDCINMLEDRVTRNKKVNDDAWVTKLVVLLHRRWLYIHELCNATSYRSQCMFPNLAEYIEHVVVVFSDACNHIKHAMTLWLFRGGGMRYWMVNWCVDDLHHHICGWLYDKLDDAFKHPPHPISKPVQWQILLSMCCHDYYHEYKSWYQCTFAKIKYFF